MSNEGNTSAAALVHEKGSTFMADAPAIQTLKALVPIGSNDHSWLVSSYGGSPEVESQPHRKEGPVVFCKETTFEAVRAGVDPREIEEMFNEADMARVEEANRLHESADVEIAEWESRERTMRSSRTWPTMKFLKKW
ncbi:hypothetical protein OROMI_017759 [Orobanche minor]